MPSGVYIRTEENCKKRKLKKMICLECGKESDVYFGSKRKYCSRQCYGVAKRGSVPWNKNLTKQTDVRVAKYAQEDSIRKRGTNLGHPGYFSKKYLGETKYNQINEDRKIKIGLSSLGLG